MDDVQTTTVTAPRTTKFNRNSSQLLASLPWRTGCIILQSNLCDISVTPKYKTLLEKLEDIGDWEVKADPVTFALLRVADEQGTTRPDENQGQPATVTPYLVRTLAALRVVDIVAWIYAPRNCHTIATVPCHRRRQQIGRSPKWPWENVVDWVQLLKNAMASIAVGVDPPPLLPQTSPDRLTCSLARMLDISEASSILVNVQLAALYLRHLVKGNLDMPSNLKTFLEDLQLPTTVLNSILKGVRNIQRFRLPLHLALFISPLYLLLTTRLEKYDWHRHSLILTWKAYGNQQPALLLVVEKELWKVLFHIAMDDVDTQSALDGFFNAVPWNELNTLPQSERTWLKTERLSTDISVRESLDLLDLEGSLPEQWPAPHPQPTSFSTILPIQPLAGGGEEASDDEAMGESFGADGMDEGNIGDGRAMGAEGMADDEDGMGDEGAMGANPGIAGKDGMDDEGVVGANPGTTRKDGMGDGGAVDANPGTTEKDGMGDEGAVCASPGITEKEGTNTPGRIEDWGGVGNKVAGDDGNQMGGEGMDAEDEIEHQEVVGNGGEEDMDIEDEINDAAGAAGATGDEDSGMDGEEEIDAVAKMDWADSPAGPTLRPRPKSLPGFKQNASPPKPPHKRAKTRSRLPNKQENASPLPGSYALPIDVDAWTSPEPDINLRGLEAPNPKIFGERTVYLYDPKGSRTEFRPSFHRKSDIDQFYGFMQSIEKLYDSNGMPLHVTNPDHSALQVMTQAQYDASSDRNVQNLLRRKNIVITDRAVPKLAFDEDGLEVLNTTMEAVTTIQDQSIDASEDYNLRCVQGTLQQLLDSTKIVPPSRAKILNALSFPMGEADLKPDKCFSEIIAWGATKELPYCKTTRHLPGDDLRWGLAATSGALHWTHIDAEGFCTFIDVLTGSKLWLLARPKATTASEGFDYKQFANIHLFSEGFKLEEPNAEKWDIEAVVLRPGSRLIMRPNTPHIVFTLEHAICVGGHFYATSTLQDTLYGLEHHFFLGHLVTNTEHIASRLLLRRFAHFFHRRLTGHSTYKSQRYNAHLPDLEQFEGVLDLFALSAIVELMNVLHPGTYRGNGLSRLERDECAVARGKCRDILKWFFAHHDLVDARNNSIVDGPAIYAEYLARHVQTLLIYAANTKAINDKETLDLSHVLGFRDQVTRCFKGVEAFHKAFHSLQGQDDDESIDSLAWPRDRYYMVRPSSKPGVPAYNTCGNFLQLGLTSDNIDYMGHPAQKPDHLQTASTKEVPKRKSSSNFEDHAAKKAKASTT